jgi:hypothetical protein
LADIVQFPTRVVTGVECRGGVPSSRPTPPPSIGPRSCRVWRACDKSNMPLRTSTLGARCAESGRDAHRRRCRNLLTDFRLPCRRPKVGGTWHTSTAHSQGSEDRGRRDAGRRPSCRRPRRQDVSSERSGPLGAYSGNPPGPVHTDCFRWHSRSCGYFQYSMQAGGRSIDLPPASTEANAGETKNMFEIARFSRAGRTLTHRKQKLLLSCGVAAPRWTTVKVPLNLRTDPSCRGRRATLSWLCAKHSYTEAQTAEVRRNAQYQTFRPCNAGMAPTRARRQP